MARVTYSDELAERIFERIEGGEVIATICAEEGMPSIRAIFLWADTREDFAAGYTRALAARSEWSFAEHERIRKTAVDRDSAAAARVQLAALEWSMAAQAPKRYGPKIDMTVDHSFDLAAVLDKRRQQVLEGNAKLGLTDQREYDE